MSKYIVDAINEICLIKPVDVHMEMQTTYGDELIYGDHSRLMTIRQIVIDGKTTDDEVFFIKVPVDPYNDTLMCVGDAAIGEINKYNDKWYTGTSQIRF